MDPQSIVMTLLTRYVFRKQELGEHEWGLYPSLVLGCLLLRWLQSQLPNRFPTPQFDASRLNRHHHDDILLHRRDEVVVAPRSCALQLVLEL